MERKILAIYVFCLLSFWSFSSIFGSHGGVPCLYDFDEDGELDDYSHSYTNHVCKKVNSNYCYFPTDSSLAPLFNNKIILSSPTLEEKFSSKYGGCGIPEYNYEDKKLKIRAKDVRVDEIRNFLNSCGSYNFDIQTDLTYKL